jgi:exodeoxyribonuclease V alpha subunit
VLVLPDRFSPLLTRELLYTGLTRARKAFTLIAPDPAVLSQAVARRTERISGLQIGLSAALGRPA